MFFVSFNDKSLNPTKYDLFGQRVELLKVFFGKVIRRERSSARECSLVAVLVSADLFPVGLSDCIR